jgi:hypothetical protein
MAKYFEIFTDQNFFEVLCHKKFPDGKYISSLEKRLVKSEE